MEIKTTPIGYYAILLIALIGVVEPFKLSLKPPSSQTEAFHLPPLYLQPPPQPPAQLYPAQPYYEQQLQQERQTVEEIDQSGVKGGQKLADRPPINRQPLPLYPPPPQPQALAYVIIRPLHTNYHYLEPFRFNRDYSPLPPFAPAAPLNQPLYEQQQQPIQQSTKGGDERTLEQHAVKGGQGPEPQYIKHDSEKEIHHQEGQDMMGAIIAKKQGKFLKLKNSFDKFAASAKSKLTLGSSYQVVSEEIVPPPPQQPPISSQDQQQQQQSQEEISLTKQEQENIRETEQQEQLKQDKEQQLPLEQQRYEPTKQESFV